MKVCLDAMMEKAMIKINKKRVEFKKFPNKEVYVDLKTFPWPEGDRIYLSFSYEDDSSLIELMFVKKILDNAGVDECSIFIDYMPYSRMDRYNRDFPFLLKYVCEFINSLGFSRVTVREPHSDVTPALLDKVMIYEWAELHCEDVMKEMGFNKDNDVLFYPDAGAQKRYSFSGYRFSVGNKTRDFRTGEITGYEVNKYLRGGGYSFDNCNVLIVDDLCSRGGTFIAAAKELKNHTSGKIYLMVAHCEENVFTGDIFDHIECIYTASDLKHKQIKVMR